MNTNTNYGNLKSKSCNSQTSVKTIMKNISSIANTGADLIKKIQPNQETEVLDIEDLLPNNGGIYDPRNYDNSDDLYEFGGNQGSLFSNPEKFLDNKYVDIILEKYFPGVEITDEDKKALFYRINSNGCGYTAACNTLMLYCMNYDEIEFYEKFGFHLYELGVDQNGKARCDYNIELLLLDFYLYYNTDKDTDHCFNTIEEIYGNAKEQMALDEAGDDATSDKKLKSTGAEGTDVDTVAREFKKYLSEKGINIEVTDEMKFELSPGSDAYKKVVQNFERLGMQVPDVIYSDELTTDVLKQLLEKDGKQIIMRDENFSLYLPYDKDGNGKLDDIASEGVGAHAMAIVKVLPDGRYLVSSWGNEYIYDPEQDADTGFDYAIYDYYPD